MRVGDCVQCRGCVQADRLCVVGYVVEACGIDPVKYKVEFTDPERDSFFFTEDQLILV